MILILPFFWAIIWLTLGALGSFLSGIPFAKGGYWVLVIVFVGGGLGLPLIWFIVRRLRTLVD